MWSAFPHSSLEFDLPARTAENYQALVPRGTAERAVFKADTQEGRGARVDLCGKQRGAPGAEWEEPRDAAGESGEAARRQGRGTTWGGEFQSCQFALKDATAQNKNRMESHA